MDRTLSDASLITQENFEEILRDIEEATTERVTLRKDEEIASLRKSHSREIMDVTNYANSLEKTTRTVEEEAKRLADDGRRLQVV